MVGSRIVCMFSIWGWALPVLLAIAVLFLASEYFDAFVSINSGN